MRFIRPSGLICVATIAMSGGAARAQTAVDPVIVTATLASTALTKVPESVSVVSASQIQATPARSLDEVLRAVPSVNLPSMASYELFPILNTVSIRGLGGSRALVLLDGVPLNDPFFGFVQWSAVPLGDVDHIEVVRGGGAALWGNYAMGGVINIQTRVPTEQRFLLDAAAGSYGTVRANLYAAIPISDHLQLSVDASSTKTDGYDPVPPAFHTPLTVPSYFKADNLMGSLQFEADPTLTGALHVGYHDADETLHTPLNTNSQILWNVSGDVAKQIGESTLTATLFQFNSRFDVHNSNTPPGFAPGTVEFVGNAHLTPSVSDGGSLVWSKTSDSWLRLASVGADFQQIHGSDVGDIYNPASTLIRVDNAHGSQQFAGIFAQAEVDPIDHLSILANARYQYFRNYDGFDGAPGGGGGAPATSSKAFDPRVSAKYDVTPIFALRGALYDAFHAPTVFSLYRGFFNAFGIFESNAALKPETLQGGEAGFDVTLPGLRTQVTYYDNTIDNLLTTRPIPHPQLPPGFNFGTININAGAARAQGVEAEVDWKIAAPLTATFAYAYADSVITSNPADHLSVGKQLGGVPRQTASVQLAYTRPGGWKLAGRVYWRDALYNDNDHTLPIGSQFNVDLSASYPIGPHFEPYVQIQNLFDEHHIADNSGSSAPQIETPMTAMVGLRVKF